MDLDLNDLQAYRPSENVKRPEALSDLQTSATLPIGAAISPVLTGRKLAIEP